MLDCVAAPGSCPMEPGCSLRRLLMDAEEEFYKALELKTLDALTNGSRGGGGLGNLQINSPESGPG